MVDVYEKTFDAYKNLKRGLEFCERNTLYVGVQEDKTVRKEDTITNAELMYKHTHGEPMNNLPARPVLEPAISHDKERLSKEMGAALKKAIEGDLSAALKGLKRTGTRAVNVSKAWFTDDRNNWPPNAPSVIAEKLRKGATDPRPLIDTGQLRNSISFFIMSGRASHDKY